MATCEADVVEAVRWAREHDVALHVLGGGSNIVVADAGVAGLVLSIALRGIDWLDDGRAVVAAGEPWDAFVRQAVGTRARGRRVSQRHPRAHGRDPHPKRRRLRARGQRVHRARARPRSAHGRAGRARQSRVRVRLSRQLLQEPGAQPLRRAARRVSTEPRRSTQGALPRAGARAFRGRRAWPIVRRTVLDAARQEVDDLRPRRTRTDGAAGPSS